MKIHGSKWRFLTRSKNGEQSVSLEDKGIFDELVVDDWLHIEQMSNNSWWMRIGDARVLVTLNKKGAPTVIIERDQY